MGLAVIKTYGQHEEVGPYSDRKTKGVARLEHWNNWSLMGTGKEGVWLQLNE